MASKQDRIRSSPDARHAAGPTRGFPASSAAAGEPPRVLVTAGPTREPIDRVRFLSNRSSGRMGIALAEAALVRGARVTLLLGPVSEPAPGASFAKDALRLLRFETTSDLARLLADEWPRHDILLMAAAVSDHRPVIDAAALDAAQGKLSRASGPTILTLEPTPDLLAGLATTTRTDQTLVGFALEPAERLEAAAAAKLRRKGLHAIVANPLETMDAPTIDGSLLLESGRVERPGRAPLDKHRFAEWLLERVMALHAERLARAGAERAP